MILTFRSSHARRWSLACVILLGGIALGRGQTRWHQEEFVLGTFWDPPFDFSARRRDVDSSRFRLAKDAHFNLLTGMQLETRGITRTPDGLRWALEIARSVGMRYLVTDSRFFPAYEHEPNRALARTITDEYKRLPRELRETFYGYNLGDEPHFTAQHVRRIAQWKWDLEGSDAEKLVYLNLVSSYGPNYNWGGFRGGNNDLVLDDGERRSYEEYVALYVDSLQPAVVSFDHYPFFANGKVRRDYFYNLGILRTKAGDHPLWAYPMTVGHLAYADPSEEQLRFMYFCPLAYGSKGLIAFSFWGSYDKDYRSALVTVDGVPTPRYTIVQRLNAYVAKIVGPVIMRVPCIGVYHATDFPSHQQFLTDTLSATSQVVQSFGDPRLLAGVFQSRTETYVLVVNKDLASIRDASITLRGVRSSILIAPRVISFDQRRPVHWASQRTRIDRVRAASTVQLGDMAAGEGVLLKILP